VGDGTKIDVWNQNWIPRSSLKHPMCHRPDKKVEKVNELLLSEDEGWNFDKLNEMFFEGDVDDILKIPAESDDYIKIRHALRVFSKKKVSEF
jgi:hypothetical protein